ncbi:SubName: Full=Related to proteophosphoglycan 5-Leishmania major strain Friedlin {ECO:0000313/EMBL:CCA75018.1} [Serendipita indica DSM 11827]|nr:SubName: Full=Related to proteophosphoglycan 5-Leishmania major strain Friedlin {ECO:0000313/EMBL:CCA75018.1} [Serendipita indica DSM 11827]
MAAQTSQNSTPTTSYPWYSLFRSFGTKAPTTPSIQEQSAAKGDFKRRRSPVQETEDESPQKRIKRSSPPRQSSALPLASNFQREGSVKKLTLDSVQSLGAAKSLRNAAPSEATFASGRTGLSRAPSTGLSVHMNRFSLQTPRLETPVKETIQIPARVAGVSQKAYNVNRSIAQADSLSFPTHRASSTTPMLEDRASVQRQSTPSGASFGPMKQPYEARSTTSFGRLSPSSPPQSKPALERHSVSAPWAGRNGAHQPHRLGNGSLSRNRTTSLLSVASQSEAPSVTSGHEERTTPTPKDGSVSSPPSVTSPSGSSVGSPPPTTVPLSKMVGHAARAVRSVKQLDTPLKHSRSYSQPYAYKVKVPVPSQTNSVASYERSSDASSTHAQIASSTARLKMERAGAPYAVAQDNVSSRSKKILERRREEEQEIDTMEMDDDLKVEPINKGKENAAPESVPMSEDGATETSTELGRGIKSRMGPLSSEATSVASSRTAGRSQLRVGREKLGHGTSASVSSASGVERRSRIASADLSSRFNPSANERYQKTRSTGRFSAPPDDYEDVVSKPSAPQEMRATPALVIPRLPTPEETRLPASEPMNISPVKETATSGDVNVDMASTTPTESSVRNAFKMTPITAPAPEEVKSVVDHSWPEVKPLVPPVKVSAPTEPSPAPVAPVSFGFTPSIPATTSAPVAPPPPAPVPAEQSSAKSESKSVTGPTPSLFAFAPPKPAETAQADKPAPALAGFSFGTPPTIPTKAPTPAAPFSLAPPPTVVVTEPPKTTFSFGAPAVEPTKPGAPAGLFGPAVTPAAEPPKLFSFTPAPVAEPPKTTGFSFGQPQPASTPSPVKEPVPEAKAPLAPFSFATPTPAASASVSTTPATPATPSPVKPAFSFPASTPTVVPGLNLGAATPSSSPFSFAESPSPAKSTQEAVDLSTPTKSTPFSFGTPSATPATPTPAPFSFGNPPSTTPSATPASQPFTFGALPSTTPASTTNTPFTFGAPSAGNTSTTPAATPAPASNGFSFSFGSSTNNPFASTTPTAPKTFTFGDSQGPTTAPPTFPFSKAPGDATPKGKAPESTPFTFGQLAPPSSAPPTGGFSFPPSNKSGLVFPTGPTTPLGKTLELDSMDASPIRGGGNGPSNGTAASSFTGASSQPFNFGPSPAPNSAPPFASSSGFGSQSGPGFGGFGKDSAPNPTPAPFSFGNASGFTAPAPTPTTPFAQTSGTGFGSGGFSFGQTTAGATASPFGQPQALPSPSVGGFTQLASPAASPFNAPAPLAGAAEGLLLGPGDRKIAPMPKPRRQRTEAERRAGLQKFHQNKGP